MSGKWGGGGSKCTICTKTVYPAETIQHEKKPYHVECFKCMECDKLMDGPAKAAGYEGKIYCHTCFKKLGLAQKQKKVVWTKKEGSSSNNALASKFGGGGSKCKVCQKTVYSAETVQYEKEPYHQACFVCSKDDCKKVLTPSGAASFENTLYCTKCFKEGGFAQKQTKTASKGTGSTNSALASKFGGGGNPCTVCAKTVYSAETVQYEKKPYHQACFVCSTESCKKVLTPSGAASFDDTLYCTKCFKEGGFAQKQAKVTTKGTGSTNSALASKFGGGGNPCTACAKTVYSAEALSFDKKIFHAACFKCSTCDRQMNASQGNQFEDKLFCTKCFTDGGYRQKQTKVAKAPGASSAGASAKFSKFGGGGNKCVQCAKTVYPAETVSYEKNFFHSECFKCTNCEKLLTPSSAEGQKKEDGGVTVYCKKCWGELGLNRAVLK